MHPLKQLVDIYDLGRREFFLNRGVDIESPTYLLFLNPRGKEFQSVGLQHLKDQFGIDAVTYDFRRAVATFAGAHESASVRMGESEALQHRPEEARRSYFQNRAVQPQLVVQTFCKSVDLFNDSVSSTVEKSYVELQSKLVETEKVRESQINADLFKEKESYLDHLMSVKPLGPKHRC